MNQKQGSRMFNVNDIVRWAPRTIRVARHHMSQVLVDIMELTSLCIASGCSPDGKKAKTRLKTALVSREWFFARKIRQHCANKNSSIDCQLGSRRRRSSFFDIVNDSISRARWQIGELTSENVNSDAFTVGVRWTASILTRIRGLCPLYQQIRRGDVSLLRYHRHSASSAVVVYLLQ